MDEISLASELENNNVILLVISKEDYSYALPVLRKQLSNLGDKVGYITINKPYASIVSELKNNSLRVDNFVFVDAITSTVGISPVVGECIFVSSPSALTDLSLAFSSLIGDHSCEVVFFDTVSTLIVYQDLGAVMKFVHNLVTKVRILNKKVIFIGLKEDSESLIKDLNMFVDKVIEI